MRFLYVLSKANTNPLTLTPVHGHNNHSFLTWNTNGTGLLTRGKDSRFLFHSPIRQRHTQMDGSHFPSDMRYVLLDRKIADLIDDLQPDDLQFLVELITSLKDCECGCRGRSHVTISTDGRRLARLVGRLRQRGPAVPDLEEQISA
jgi:hypothetical protein